MNKNMCKMRYKHDFPDFRCETCHPRQKIKVLSLFDGISCARVALERAGFEIDTYYASEVDKYAIQVAQKNHPNTIQVGDVKKLSANVVDRSFLKLDLLIGGSPCQDLSIAKKDRKGLDGERSGLFWEYVRILKEIKPKYFVLENVNSMPKEAKDLITKTLGVEPVMINAALVSAQNRKRLFWTNIPNVTQPEDKEIYLKDILEKNVDEKYTLSETLINGFNNKQGSFKGRFSPIKNTEVKCPTLTARYFKMSATDPYIQLSGKTGQLNTIRVGQIGKGGQGDRIYSTDGKSVNLSANGGAEEQRQDFTRCRCEEDI